MSESVTVVRLGGDHRATSAAAAASGWAPSPSRLPGGSGAAAIAVLIPFREDGTGRGRQLSALLARLAVLFPAPGQCVVVVAEQSVDERRFNRGQLLNAAFLHLRDAHPEWTDDDTLYCFHDCDMLPAPSCAPHYLRPLPRPSAAPGDPEAETGAGACSPSSSASFPAVRVLQAGGSRYDGDACFGGVTVYNLAGYLTTNGYPNGFWGWGGEDNAQFLRCVEQRLTLERVAGCQFDDLEGIDTVEEKLRRLDAMSARCSAKVGRAARRHPRSRVDTRSSGLSRRRRSNLFRTARESSRAAAPKRALRRCHARHPGVGRCPRTRRRC